MKLQRFALVLAGAGLLAATAASGPAFGATQSGPAPASGPPCGNQLVWPTAKGTVESAEVIPAKPPRALRYEPFKFFATRSMATWYVAQNSAGTRVYAYGLFLQGSNLYRHTTVIPNDGSAPRPTAAKVGSGWGTFKAIATSNHSVGAPNHAYLYGLNANGRLYRYAKSGAGYKALGSFGGYASFKAMTVISETQTYDTLLMTTKAGALYTVHLPITAKTTPVVKLIRKTGWAAYESLVVEGCNFGGSLVVGIDHDTDSGYQYAFGHAKGTATAITAYGKIPVVFNGISHAAQTSHYVPLEGE
ncbi:hypothetical protein [Kribbella ginsengisoli]|uniref:Tachylectin 2 domain-containing protein n=1 Tax=Kribbella ginsengisoli TaxID=363865 RepID=A0ABP6WQC6_9ACTN